MEADQIRRAIRDYILAEFIDEQDRPHLRDDTPLFSSGVLNSLALVSITEFLETKFGLALHPTERGAAQLDTIDLIVSKVGAGR